LLGAAAPAPAGTIYTCPMHPQVRQVGPGACPICGMALEPELITAEPQANPELADMTRRLWVAAVLTAPVFASQDAREGARAFAEKRPPVWQGR